MIQTPLNLLVVVCCSGVQRLLLVGGEVDVGCCIWGVVISVSLADVVKITALTFSATEKFTGPELMVLISFERSMTKEPLFHVGCISLFLQSPSVHTDFVIKQK